MAVLVALRVIVVSAAMGLRCGMPAARLRCGTTLRSRTRFFSALWRRAILDARSGHVLLGSRAVLDPLLGRVVFHPLRLTVFHPLRLLLRGMIFNVLRLRSRTIFHPLLLGRLCWTIFYPRLLPGTVCLVALAWVALTGLHTMLCRCVSFSGIAPWGLTVDVRGFARTCAGIPVLFRRWVLRGSVWRVVCLTSGLYAMRSGCDAMGVGETVRLDGVGGASVVLLVELATVLGSRRTHLTLGGQSGLVTLATGGELRCIRPHIDASAAAVVADAIRRTSAVVAVVVDHRTVIVVVNASANMGY